MVVGLHKQFNTAGKRLLALSSQTHGPNLINLASERSQIVLKEFSFLSDCGDMLVCENSQY